jgi:chromosome segregation ATPase
MLKRMKDELAKYKSDNTRLKEQLSEAEEGRGLSQEASSGWETERASLNKQIDSLQADLKISVSQLERQMADVKRELAATQQDRDLLKQSHDETQRQLSASTQQARSDLAQLQQENALLERRAQDAEQKVSLLLDQVEQSVDTYRRQSRQVESNGGPGTSHQRTLSASESVSESSLYDGGNRNSTALDSLANELETLRSHWENTNKNYRLSNAFEFEERTPIGRSPGDSLVASNAGDGLSGSLADWRKRLDAEEEVARSRKGSNNETSPGGGIAKREMSPSEVGGGAAGKSQVNLI